MITYLKCTNPNDVECDYEFKLPDEIGYFWNHRNVNDNEIIREFVKQLVYSFDQIFRLYASNTFVKIYIEDNIIKFFKENEVC